VRRSQVALAVTVAALAISPAGAAAVLVPSGATSVRAVGCKRAKIAGHRVCLAAGQRCKTRYEKQYVKYGFSCAGNGKKGQHRLVANKLAF
jgi:hypothetical protein